MYQVAQELAKEGADRVTGPYTFIKGENPNAGKWPMNYPEELKSKSFPDNMKSWSEEWVQDVKDGMIMQRDFEKGQMARDMTLFVDDDGKAYHIHSTEENLTLNIAELTCDYQNCPFSNG